MEIREIEKTARKQLEAMGQNFYDIGMINQEGKVMSDIRQQTEITHAIFRCHNFNVTEHQCTSRLPTNN